jgi:hypothetical protein
MTVDGKAPDGMTVVGAIWRGRRLSSFLSGDPFANASTYAICRKCTVCSASAAPSSS